MATSNAPLPDPTPNQDDLLPPIETPMPEDLGEGVPLGEGPEEFKRSETIRDRF